MAQIETRDQPPAGRIVLTYEDYCALPNDGRRYEILDGELAVTPAPETPHQIALMNLAGIVRNHVITHRLGRLLPAPTDLLLEKTTVVQPDLLFVAHDRQTIVTRRAVEGPPDLVVEILSESTERLDRTDKAQLYARHGVPHYWLVDPDSRTIETFELAEGRYCLTAHLAGDVAFAPSLFPGLTISLRSLWE